MNAERTFNPPPVSVATISSPRNQVGGTLAPSINNQQENNGSSSNGSSNTLLNNIDVVVAGEIFIAKHAFKASEPNQLTFEKGAMIRVTSKENMNWWQGVLNGKRGWLPAIYLKPHNPDVSNFRGSEITDSRKIANLSQVPEDISVLEASLRNTVSKESLTGDNPKVQNVPAVPGTDPELQRGARATDTPSTPSTPGPSGPSGLSRPAEPSTPGKGPVTDSVKKNFSEPTFVAKKTAARDSDSIENVDVAVTKKTDILGNIGSIVLNNGYSAKELSQVKEGHIIPIQKEGSVIPVQKEGSIIPVQKESSVIPVQKEDSIQKVSTGVKTLSEPGVEELVIAIHAYKALEPKQVYL